MVVHVFPAFKLGVLLLKQISKPIAGFIKDTAKNHPVFRKYFCMPPAYVYNWCEVRTKMWMLNTGRPVKIPQLNDAMAIEIGANLLGELIMFVIAAALVFAEVSRQSRKEEYKEGVRKEELRRLYRKIEDLKNELVQQEEQIAFLHSTVQDLEGKSIKLPWALFSRKSSREKDKSCGTQPPPLQEVTLVSASTPTPTPTPTPTSTPTPSSANNPPSKIIDHHHHHHHHLTPLTSSMSSILPTVPLFWDPYFEIQSVITTR